MSSPEYTVPNCLSQITATLLKENAKTEFQQSKFADITFIIGKEKKEFPVIRGIFAMQCPYFAKKWYHSEYEMHYGQKFVEDDINVTETGFKFIHELFYRLDHVITAENVIDVLYAAKKYGLQNLSADCNSFIDAIYESAEYNTNISHILLFETRAIQLNLKVNHVIRQRFQNWLTVETSQQIIKSKAFLLAPKELIIYIIQNDSFSVQEEEIWIRCKQWCVQQIQIDVGCDDIVEQEMTWHVLMRKHFVKHIRFGLIPQQFFVKHIYPSHALSIEESMKIALQFMDSTTKTETELEMMKSQLDIYKNAKVLQYKLELSSKYKNINNTYEGLTNNNVKVGVATNNSTNEYVTASFSGKQHIVRMDIGGSGNMSEERWSVAHLNNRTIQYKDNLGNWKDWKVITGLQQGIISVMEVGLKTNAIRIFDKGQRHISIGCWRFYGYNVANIHVSISYFINKTTDIICKLVTQYSWSFQKKHKNAKDFKYEHLESTIASIIFDYASENTVILLNGKLTVNKLTGGGKGITGWNKKPQELNFGNGGLVGGWWKQLDITTYFNGKEVVIRGVKCNYKTNPFNVMFSNDGVNWTAPVKGQERFAEAIAAKYGRMVWEKTNGSNGFHAQFMGYTDTV